MWSPVPSWFLPEPEVDLYLLKLLHSKKLSRDFASVYINQLQCIMIFTDGSRDPDSRKTGFGMYVENIHILQSVRISDNLSVFTSELLAILWAVWWIGKVKPSKSVICSGSAAALMAVKEGMSSSRPDLLQEILCCLYQIENAGCHVKFLWVPGHSGIKGNEISDKLAKGSLSKETVELKVPLGKSEYFSLCKGKVERQWQKQWEEEQKGRHYFSLQPSVRRQRLVTRLCRKDDVVLTRLRLGHCGLVSYLNLIGKHPDGLCKCGGEKTAHHVVFVCTNYRRERQALCTELSDLGLSSFS